MASPKHAGDMPARGLRVVDAVAMIVGLVIGAGIFRAPATVASGAADERALIVLWVLGGVVSLIGAMCYAELTTAFPHAGGEYHFLSRAFGRKVGFLFAWARLTVIPTGSIALLAFVFGDYLVTVVPLGPGGNALAAGGLVISLTALNVMGLRFGRGLQNVVTVLVVVGLVAMTAVGLWLGAPRTGPEPPAPTASAGLAMIFVLLTYGGWNEAAYLSAEVRGGRRGIAVALLTGVAAVTVLYVLINLAYLRAFGLEGLRASRTVAADLMRRISGPLGAGLVSLLIAAAALISANATVVTGSRTGFALGRDFGIFRRLGRWSSRADAPIPALLLQGALALVLVILGGLFRRGFETMVEYTAPVFWTFFLLTGIALLVLRVKEPHAPRPFRVPLYPLTPVIFCMSSAWLLYSSITYTRVGAVVGLLVLACGAVPLWLEQRRAMGWNTGSREERA